MNGEYGNDFITVTDEEGNEFELEHISTVEIEDVIYMAFIPADLEEDDDDFGLIILKNLTDQFGVEELVSIDDDDELKAVYDVFMEVFEEEGLFDEEDSDE